MFSIAFSSLLLIFILSLLVLTSCKHKVYGFTFHLLVCLAAVTAMTLGQGFLLLDYLDKGGNESEAYVDGFCVLAYFSTAGCALIYWIFAIKYWSIAKKLELIYKDEDMNKNNTFICVVMFAGIALILMATGVAIYGLK